jgi:hypothetical protein
VLDVILGAILPTDEAGLLDRMAWTAYFAAILTDPSLPAGATDHPHALEDYLTATVTRAQAAGDIAGDRDARTEVVTSSRSRTA